MVKAALKLWFKSRKKVNPDGMIKNDSKVLENINKQARRSEVTLPNYISKQIYYKSKYLRISS